MKKLIYLFLALILLGVGAYFLFLRDSDNSNNNGVDVAIEQGDKLNWSAYFPESVPEYINGEIREMSEVDSELSRFKDEVAVIIDDTSHEEFDSYVEELVEDGWIITYQTPEPKGFYNIQLSLEENRISASLNDEGVLRLSTYVVEE